MRALTTLVLTTLMMSTSMLAQQSADIRRAVATITPDDIRQRIGKLADDSMMGRDTPSPGLEQAAAWIAAEFGRLGLEPAGDAGGYIQRYPLVQLQVDVVASRVRLQGEDGWRFGRDVIHHRGATAGEGFTAPVSFLAGTPRNASELADLPDMSDAVLIWQVPAGRGGVPNLRMVGAALGQLEENAPRAVILLTNRAEAAWQQALAQMDDAPLTPAWRVREQAPILEMREVSMEETLARFGVDLVAVRDGPFAVRRLSRMRMDLGVSLRAEVTAGAPNVAGLLRGSDPTLQDEYLVFSAHMDHVGVGRPVDGDSIYNGADDDASGTAAIIELAEAYATLETAPRRSMIFLTVSGEEHGLWGSDYFAANSPVPVDQIVANLNADMIGRNWKDTIVVIGKEHSDLGQTLNRVNNAHPELNMTAIDDIWPEERFYFRSDHFNFARRGVPVLFFFSGTHPQYHRPSDEVELIDAEKESRIVQLMFYLGIDVANRAQRPQWDPTSYQQIVQPDLTGG
jgi:hypothetical protein